MKPINQTTGQGGSSAPARIVYYEPKHQPGNMLHVMAAFESRGYRVTTKNTGDAAAWVFTAMNGVDFLVDLGDIACDLTPFDRWASPTAYVTGIVDWIERTSAGGCIEPGARVIYYEPVHNEATMALIRRTLAERGYVIARPDLWYLDVVDVDAPPELHVDVDQDGVQTILHGDTGVKLEQVGSYMTVESYALAIADWFDSDHTAPPAAPIAEETDSERATWLAGMRAFCDLAAANSAIPLPHRSEKALTFYVSEAEADQLAVHLQGVREEQRPGYYIQNRRITGKLGGQDVVVYFGTRTGVTV